MIVAPAPTLDVFHPYSISAFVYPYANPNIDTTMWESDCNISNIAKYNSPIHSSTLICSMNDDIIANTLPMYLVIYDITFSIELNIYDGENHMLLTRARNCQNTIPHEIKTVFLVVVIFFFYFVFFRHVNISFFIFFVDKFVDE